MQSGSRYGKGNMETQTYHTTLNLTSDPLWISHQHFHYEVPKMSWVLFSCLFLDGDINESANIPHVGDRRKLEGSTERTISSRKGRNLKN